MRAAATQIEISELTSARYEGQKTPEIRVEVGQIGPLGESEGEWVSGGEWHGQGVISYYDTGQRYEGRFRNGMLHGYGRMTFPDHGNGTTVQSGKFKHQKFQG